MSLTRPQKFRPIWIAGIAAVVVGGTGTAFAVGPFAGHGSTDHTSLAASSLGLDPTATASASPTSASPTATSTTGAKPKKHRHKKHRHHGHGHGKPTGAPTTSPADPTASPTDSTTPSAEPTTPSADPTTPTTAPTTTSAAPTTSPSSGGTQTQQYQAEVLRLVNVERDKAGCNPLTANSALTTAAQDHAEDMLKNNYFDHNSQDGTSPFTRITSAGYKWSGAAENIAAGQQTPAAVMTAWMNSAGHKANILNCGLKEIGVGYAAGSGATYGQYWVQDFGSPA